MHDVDPEAEAREEAKRLKKEKKQEKSRERAAAKRQAADDAIDEASRRLCVKHERLEGMSSQLGTNDRTDSYRGIKLATEDAVEAPAPPPARDPALPPPKFKKRKVSGNRKKVGI